ncbi:Sperm nuclear basic protein PL-I isoform PLIb [Rhodotorula toruloides ATCC 204091]|uniref:Sperm nuclear basic protein PL-I isoform PLIb n=1 Tax=Rhodotorula toruloides TaxID=5286 RepID=A0A0K3CCB6_RHOTO|nr:Sperm nuclear basic protein PL-I isoform PLIb [Rhodotorula toruloides ATCC 204091]PRQ74304.1 sperm nuclear basic protein PL-I isoform PLIb [Rhodotorula toruloides]
MLVEGFKLDIDKSGRAVISSPTSKGSSRVDTRSTTFASPSKTTVFPAPRNAWPIPRHSTAARSPSQSSPSLHDAGGRVDGREEDEGRVLLSQFTFASPSPKKKRGVPLPMEQAVSWREKVQAEWVEGDNKTTAELGRASLQLDPFSPTGGQRVYEMPVPPHLVFATPRAAPTLPRLPSIGTALSTLAIDEHDGHAAPHPQVTHVAPLALVSPPSPFPALASDLLELLRRADELPDGLVNLLEACVAEGKACLETGELPHPDYPRSFGRPLRFIFETGLESYEEQREGRNYLPEFTPPPKKKRKKAGKAKGRHAEADEEEEEQDDGDSAYVPRANASRRGSVLTVMGEDFDGDGYDLRRLKRVRLTQ